MRRLTHADVGGVTDATPTAPDDDGVMTGSGSHHRRPSDQDRAFFEAIAVMRGRYATRGAEDATAVISVRHAIVEANTAMARHLPSPSARLTKPQN